MTDKDDERIHELYEKYDTLIRWKKGVDEDLASVAGHISSINHDMSTLTVSVTRNEKGIEENTVNIKTVDNSLHGGGKVRFSVITLFYAIMISSFFLFVGEIVLGILMAAVIQYLIS